MSFEKKKIQVETLSEYLASVRKNLKFSQQEVCDKTGIKPKFLACLESGDFMQLPPDVYVLGFLAQLARLYSVDADELAGQYKKEKGIVQQLAAKPHGGRGALSSKVLDRLVITPKILSAVFGLAFVCLS